MNIKKVCILPVFTITACVAIFLLSAIGCSNSGTDVATEEKGNSKPTVIFPERDGELMVFYAGNSSFNDAYAWDFMWSYHRGGAYHVQPVCLPQRYWMIYKGAHPASYLDASYYVESTDAFIPPATGWSVGIGTAPAPTLVGPGPFHITNRPPGYWYYFPGRDSICAHYLYADEEGDPEGAIQFQWYRRDHYWTGPWIAIEGATSSTHALSWDDNCKWLRIQITPVAANGQIQGDPVLSDSRFVYALW